MKKLLSLFFIGFMLASFCAHATHIFGVDLYYTYVSGNTYTINMAIYGDCSATAGVLNSLYTATPEVQVYNGGTLAQTVNLNPVNPEGAEVTPVCASQANNTTCSSVNNTVPGVRKFVYSLNVTLSGASANWRFHFDGNMGGGTQAGRSATITNIINGGASLVSLDAKLNNSSAPNSSSVYTTIPTPFFCINKPANFNPGAVDPNGDSLSFALVPGINQSTGTSVTYVNPFTATAPLAVAAGSFTFTPATGQLAFIPNAIQRSLVVYTVSEYRNGVLVGTSQREMTFVVLSCNNPPPVGNISNITATGSGVSAIDNTHLNACGSAGSFSFHINPTDSNTTANITVSVAGLPNGATFNVTGNNTPTPQGLFSWNTIGVAAGTYIFYITFKDDACPLSSTQTVAYTINILPFPSNIFSLVSAATCTKKAVFHITPGGAGSPYTIQVIQGGTVIQTNPNIITTLTDSLSPGTYTIRVLNTNNCNADTSITIDPPIVIVPSVTATAPLCPGGNTGSLSVTATGGVPPYTYAIGAGVYNTSNSFMGLVPGAYTLHVKDANLCIKDTAVTVPDAPHTYFNAGIARPSCNYFTNGIISVSGYNSPSPYTYAIGSGAYNGSGTFNNLNVGTYALHIKNANGCVNDTSITLTDSLFVTAVLALTNVQCYSGTSGSINITPSGGYGSPYNYAINGGPYGASGSFLNLPVGTYALQIRDYNQCFFDTTVTLIQPSPLVLTPNITNITCYGAANGSIVAATTGGTPSYSYTLNGAPQAGNSFSPLAAGPYTVQVTDQHNCTLSSTVSITQPAQLTISSVTIHNVSCNGGQDGSITVNATGGTTPYSYAVNAGAFSVSNILGGLTMGSYAVHIKDANGCTKDTTMSITQPTVIVPAVTVKNSTCHTLSNGSVTVTATGGTPAYTYSNGSGPYTSPGTFTALPGGVYTFHVKDANGCIQNITASIIDSLVISGTFFITRPLCYSQSNGFVIVNGAGGQAPYTYAFTTNPYSTTDTFKNLGVGSYTFHIKDNHGCIDDTTIAVAQPAIVAVLPAITQPSCYGYSNGHIVVTAAGGTPGYTYAINSGNYAATDSFYSLAAGHDTLHVKDANGCVHDTVITMAQPSLLKINGLTISDVKCFGDSSGKVIVYASGAVSPYTYTADSSSIYHTSDTVSNLATGRHLIMVKDNNGCHTDSAINLTQPSRLGIKVDSLVEPTCQGYKDGSVKIDGTGGTVPYTYNIDNTAYSTQHAWYQLTEGGYTFYVQDKNNCIYDTAINLKGYPHIIIDAVTLQAVTCYGARTGKIDLVVTGGVQPLSYRLNTYGIATKAGNFDSIKAGQYTIFITDSMQCKKDTLVTLTQPDSLHIVTIASPNECEGADTSMGAVTAAVTGGTTPYNYLWNTNPAQSTPTISGMPNGTYLVRVTDANSCRDSAITDIHYDDCCKPFLPNAFTPNNDGKNDVFRVVFKGDLKIEQFFIYNRFGQRVFNTIYIGVGWDGTYNGTPQDMGTYFYFLKAICGNKGDHEVVLEGNVTLIR
jgi:gliding motility-associated-like protein